MEDRECFLLTEMEQVTELFLLGAYNLATCVDDSCQSSLVL